MIASGALVSKPTTMPDRRQRQSHGRREKAEREAGAERAGEGGTPIRERQRQHQRDIDRANHKTEQNAERNATHDCRHRARDGMRRTRLRARGSGTPTCRSRDETRARICSTVRSGMTNRPRRQQCEQYSFAEALRLSSSESGMPQD